MSAAPLDLNGDRDGELAETSSGLAEHETLTLSSRDWDAFLTALDEADKPCPRLEAAARRYCERRTSRDAD